MSPRHEIEHADEYPLRGRDYIGGAFLVANGGLALYAIGSLALSFFGGIGGLSTVLGGAGGAVGIPEPPASYSAPNAPVVSAVMFEDTAGYATASAFVGSLDDTLAYAFFEWDSLRGTGWDLVTPDTQQANGGHPLRSDTLLAALTASDTFKVRVTHHGALSDLEATSVVDTFVAITVNASVYDPYLPASWTDTVHYEDFTSLETGTRTDDASWFGEPYPEPWTLESVGYECHGGNISGYGGTLCVAQDSVVFANQPSPPWVWESTVPSGSASGLQFGIVFEDGNGSGAAANLTRLYVRFSIFYEDSTVGIGENNYVWHPNSNKYWELNGISSGVMLGWDGAAPSFVGQSSPNTAGGCNYALVSNTWIEYEDSTGHVAGDTISPFSSAEDGTCVNRGIGGWGTTGVWQHHFVCMDFSPSAGSRVMSWGMYSENKQGIAGYHDNVTNYNAVGVGTYTDFDGWVWNGTYGGGAPYPTTGQSIWFDDILIMTGSSGSCVTPPSFN